MKYEDFLKAAAERKIVPVVKLDRVEDAVPLAEALSNGGLPVAEITFRTSAAEESIRRVKKSFPEMMLGAGTVVNVEQAQKAIDAGAEFLVSPGTDCALIEFAQKNDIAIVPGACTPSEAMTLIHYGLTLMKFFPARQYGGLATIKSLAAPFPDMRFMPTGGVDMDNMKEYLSYDKILAIGGSWMVKSDLITSGKFDEIARLSKEAVDYANTLR